MPLLIVEHSGRRKRATLNGRTSIGRVAGNDVVIDHPAISRTHALIENIGENYFISDTGSKNGTLVGEAKVERQRPLNDGDRIFIGPAILTFRMSEEYVEPPGQSPTLSETHAG